MNMKKYGKDCKLIWKDTKRWCGLPLTFTKYYVIENPGRWTKLYFESGFLHTQIEEVHIYRIDDFSIYESLSNKMFGVGNIDVYFSDASHNQLRISRIKNARRVYNLLSDLVEKERANKGVKFSEFQR